MKKFSILFLTAAVLILTGCSPQNTVVPDDEGITASTEQTDITTAPYNLSTTADTEEFTTEPLTESQASTEAFVTTTTSYYDYTADYPTADISQYNGKFYQWEYDMDIVAKSEEEFEGGREVIEAAKNAAEEYFKALWENAEYSEYCDCDAIFFDYGYWNWIYHIYEEDYDTAFELKFSEGVYDDFDGNGSKESIVIFNNSNLHYIPIYFAAFVDSDGNPQALTESVGILESYIYPVRYNGFTHIIIDSGYNNSTQHAEFYAVENGEVVHKHSEYIKGEPYKDVFMNVMAVQRSGPWLIFWNDELKQYCTLAGDELSDQEAEELFQFYSETFDANVSSDYLEDKYTEPKQIKANARRIDNIYCLDLGGFIWCYQYIDGKFDFADTSFIPGEDLYTEVFVSGIDFDKVKDNTVMLND